jgi:predicted negative regulator of RcsB-dependent stress response
MAEVKQPARHTAESEVIVERARDFWEKNGKVTLIVLGVVILLVGGIFVYKNFVEAPKEKKAMESMFRAEEYFRADSLNLAINGDAMNPGFEKIIKQYGGTNAGNLAKFYAGSAYLKLGNFGKAVSYLSDFHTDAKQIQARAYKLLGDAYAENGKPKDALDSYKKAAHEFEVDEVASSEALFMAAYLADRVLNNKSEAINLYKELKKNYPRTQYGFEADKYLAQAGVYNTED